MIMKLFPVSVNPYTSLINSNAVVTITNFEITRFSLKSITGVLYTQQLARQVLVDNIIDTLMGYILGRIMLPNNHLYKLTKFTDIRAIIYDDNDNVYHDGVITRQGFLYTRANGTVKLSITDMFGVFLEWIKLVKIKINATGKVVVDPYDLINRRLLLSITQNSDNSYYVNSLFSAIKLKHAFLKILPYLELPLLNNGIVYSATSALPNSRKNIILSVSCFSLLLTPYLAIGLGKAYTLTALLIFALHVYPVRISDQNNLVRISAKISPYIYRYLNGSLTSTLLLIPLPQDIIYNGGTMVYSPTPGFLYYPPADFDYLTRDLYGYAFSYLIGIYLNQLSSSYDGFTSNIQTLEYVPHQGFDFDQTVYLNLDSGIIGLLTILTGNALMSFDVDARLKIFDTNINLYGTLKSGTIFLRLGLFTMLQLYTDLFKITDTALLPVDNNFYVLYKSVIGDSIATLTDTSSYYTVKLLDLDTSVGLSVVTDDGTFVYNLNLQLTFLKLLNGYYKNVIFLSINTLILLNTAPTFLVALGNVITINNKEYKIFKFDYYNGLYKLTLYGNGYNVQ